MKKAGNESVKNRRRKGKMPPEDGQMPFDSAINVGLELKTMGVKRDMEERYL